MEMIKLDATDSTNTYLKNLMLRQAVKDFTVVQAYSQYAGRGQMGTSWTSEPGKNLTFSVLKKFMNLPARRQFSITMVTSLGVYSALKQLQIPGLRVKWPNDILSGGSKICGMLIENMTSGLNIQSSIVGIGLNVNQLDFGELEKVSSLQLLLGHPLNPEEVLHTILSHLKESFRQLETRSYEEIKSAYEQLLFRKDKPSTFRNKTGELFMGFIRGVSSDGKLRVEMEDKQKGEFDMKEVQLLH
jgi:BirA family biotin operon repressor/biotin-[acetyl-CoA-carboxylase] ligase